MKALAWLIAGCVALLAGSVNAIAAGNYLRVPVVAGQTRDEGKLFLTSLRPSARIPSDAQVFNIQFKYQPNAAPQVPIDQWIAASDLPVDKPVTGLTARADAFTRGVFVSGAVTLLNTLKTQQGDIWYYRFDWDKEPAPFNDIYGAAHGFDLPFPVRQLRAIVVLECRQ